jgi:hypothetical protein
LEEKRKALEDEKLEAEARKKVLLQFIVLFSWILQFFFCFLIARAIVAIPNIMELYTRCLVLLKYEDTFCYFISKFVLTKIVFIFFTSPNRECCIIF